MENIDIDNRISHKGIKDHNESELLIILRFSSSGRVYSLRVPNTWTVDKLEEFIKFSMKEEVQNSKINLLLGAKKLENSNEKLRNFLKSDNKEIIQIIVSIQKNPLLSERDSDKKFWYRDSTFEKTENIFFNSYKEIVNRMEENIPKDNTYLYKLPLMHPGLNQRLTSINEKFKLDMISVADFGNIENFCLRDYFKIELLFKLFFFFILFGIHMRGVNLPIFIALLVIYYWYYIYMDINAFYDKKIAEIKLTKDEIKEVKKELKSDVDNQNLYEEEINDADDKNMQEIRDSNNNNKVKETDAEENDLNNEIDVDYDLNFVKDNAINSENENIFNQSKTITNENKRDEKLPEMEGISNLMKKYENSEKRKNSINKNNEGAIKHYGSFIFEILFTFFMSLFPFWYDDFELLNPVITQNNTQNNTDNTAPRSLIDDNLNTNRQNENNLNVESLNSQDNIEKIKQRLSDVEDDSLRPEIETINKKEKLPDYSKSQASERILIKSSNDTRLVNHSEEHNTNNAVTKYILVDENENRTENEFVFSENVNIDTLSYNEPILESLRKKNEKENDDNINFN